MGLAQEQIEKRIAEIDSILRAGATSSTLDGVTVSWDLDEMRKERADLARELPDGSKNRKRRPVMYRNNFGGGA